MKKLLFVLVMLFNITAVFSLDINSSFGFQKQSSEDKYQQYVGKAFLVRPAFGKLETWDKSGILYSDYLDNMIYTISKITVKYVLLNNKPNKLIKVQAVGKNTYGSIRFKTYEDNPLKRDYIGSLIKYPLIDHMPIVFIEPFMKYKAELIGKTISHEMVNDEYEITDVFIGNGTDGGEPNVAVKNKRTGDVVKCKYSDVHTAPFEEALKGRYNTTLVKVEMPEDSKERYGEFKIVQDDGIDKYSFSDSIIDIFIYGNEEEFLFKLKNVSDHSIKVIWNEAAFVGIDGNSSKIMHSGIKYSERDSDQPATTIIKGASINDLAAPINNVYYSEGELLFNTIVGTGWKTKSMLPAKYEGKDLGEIRLMLPIQVKDVINEYTFVFKVSYTYDHPELLKAEK